MLSQGQSIGAMPLFDTSPDPKHQEQLSTTQQLGESDPAGSADPHQLPSPAPLLPLGLAPVSQGLQEL